MLGTSHAKSISKRGVLKNLLGLDNNIEFLKRLIEKLKYREETCLILKLFA